MHKLSIQQQEMLKEKIKNYKNYNHIVKQFPDLVDELKMMYKIKEQKALFNRLAADTILIFCNMIRLLSSKNT